MYTKQDYIAALVRTAAEIGVHPVYLDAVILSESGRNPQATNNAINGGAVGLIQFIPRTRAALGITKQQILQADAQTHFQYVRRYFDSVFRAYGVVPQRDIQSAADLYAYVFYPSKARNLAISQGTQAYALNRGLDKDGNGVIDKRDLAQQLLPKVAQSIAYLYPNNPKPTTATTQRAAGASTHTSYAVPIVGATVAGIALYYLYARQAKRAKKQLQTVSA